LVRYLIARKRSFGFAFKGVRYLLVTQPHARIHLVATVAVIGMGAWLNVSRIDWALLSIAIGSVWAAEALNTAIELVVDIASPQHQTLAGHAKDVAAAGVLLISVAAATAGCLVFWPYLQPLF